MPDDDRYSLTELADLAGVTPRTVRYYIGQGLLPSVGPSGPGAKYDEGHLARLRLIRRLQAEHLPLAEIRRRTSQLRDDEILDLAGQVVPSAPPDSALDYLRKVLGEASIAAERRPRSEAHGTPPPARSLMQRVEMRPLSAASAPAPAKPARQADPTTLRSQWDRIVLTPDIELHVRRPLDRAHIKQVDRLVTIARELLEEEDA